MAVIKFGMMMTDARGKLGGQVFTKTRSGATVRTKVTPTNPQTTAQQTARTILGALSSQWRELTEAQRTAWNSAVGGFANTNIFGDTYNPSGKNLFVGLNSNLLNAQQTVQTNAPTPVEVPPLILTSAGVEQSTSEISLTFATAYPSTSYTVFYQATKPNSAGRFNFSGQYSTFTKNNSGVALTEAFLFNAYVLKFGYPPLGSKISFKVFVVVNSNGQKSVESTNEAIVAL